MKVLFIKKATLLILIFICVCVLTVGVNWKVANLSEVYFNTSLRRVPIYSVETDDNTVAISFDAAWGADKTEEIMSVCDSYGVKATFFLVGFWIEKYPDMVKSIYNKGFEIGIHSNTHPDMTKLSRNEIYEELTTNMELVRNITGTMPKLFRPPYGYYNNALIETCDNLNLSVIEWSVDSLDWKGISASELSGRVISKAKSGSIILFHNNSDNIINGLKMVLSYFQSTNVKVVPVGELIYYDDYIIDSTGTQKCLTSGK